MIWARRLLLVAAIIFAGQRAALAIDSDYTINAGDVLQITVWKEDGLDREVLVLPDGSASFPLIGSFAAKGKTPAKLQEEIGAKLMPYIKDPSVAVSVKAALGYSVDVIGQVNKPGELIVGHPVSVLQALTIAGGLTPFASQSRIIVIRRDGNKRLSIPFPYNDVIRGQSLNDDIMLLPGDVVVVPASSLF